jgi:hypothetical protein
VNGQTPLARLVLAGFVWIAIFSLLFSIGVGLDVWPRPPHGGFQGIDLVAGLAFGVALLLVFIAGHVRRGRPPGSGVR